jgi:hypothetical protein
MAEIPRLNGVIQALEQGKPTFVTFSPAEIGAAQAINGAPYDGVVFEMSTGPTISVPCATACNSCWIAGK